MSGTTFESKTVILSELWMNYRADEEFQDFIEYGDLAFPLAYAISNDIVKTTPQAEGFINEIWEMLLEMLGLFDNDFGWTNLDEMLQVSSEQQE